MKTIAVILPVNNPEILSQADLEPYNTSEIKFVLHYIDTDLKESTKAGDTDQILPLLTEKAHQQKQNGASAIVVYAFGEACIKELKTTLGIPIMALGTEAIKQASAKANKKFTIISGSVSHNDFWQPMVERANLEYNYIPSLSAPEVSPAEIRKDPMIIEKLVTVAKNEINNNNVDSFTLGCGSFIDVVERLEATLHQEFGASVHVIDPVSVTFELIKQKIA